jgi:hypothetical protein
MKTSSFLFAACLCLSIVFTGDASFGQTLQVIHLINNAGSNALTSLNAGSNFITSFKGSNDVVITPVKGPLNSLLLESLGSSHAANNPLYATTFAGSTSLGTGDGIVGDIKTFETALGAVSNVFRFDFSVPLTSLDHVLLFDVESGEKYGLQAFVLRSGVYQQVSMTNWAHENYAGQTGVAPDATWAIWDSTNGLLTAATTAGQSEPLVVLTPDQPIDRVVFSRYELPGGSASIQFLAELGSIAAFRLQIQKAGTNVVISWPADNKSFKLYEAGSIAPGASWTLNTNPAVMAGNFVLVTNRISQGRYYRVQNQ